jgi:hypothetical protein
MSRVLAFVFALAMFAGASAHSEEDRSAYAQATARLTEQLNAKFSEGIDLGTAAPPPAKRDEIDDESALPSPMQASR